MEHRRIDIATNFNDLYVKQGATMILSALATNPDRDIYVHVFTDALSDTNVGLLQQTVQDRRGQVIVHPIGDDLLGQFPECHYLNFARVLYGRLLMPQMLDTGIKRVLYLDADTIVAGDISELWETDLQGKTIGVVPDMLHWNRPLLHQYTDIDVRDVYFNGGVILFDLERWRATHVTERLMRFAVAPPCKIFFADQDLLNIVLEHEKYELPLRCNAQEGFFGDMPDVPATVCRQLRQAALDPLIVHFLGYEENRPWSESCTHRLRHLWRRYYALTPWGLKNISPKIDK